MISDRTTSEVVDWASVWKNRMGRNLRPREGAGCASVWQDRHLAARYDARVRKDGRSKALATIARLDLSANHKVLDIGAGPGTHTIPLSRLVGRVTAVEPSEGMAGVLAANVAQEGIANVICIRKKWEDVTLSELGGPYDVVLASLSLGMPDIRAALEKMDHVCCGKVYLIWPVGVTAWERHYSEAWPLVHGETYVSGPKADVLFNVLLQMGICPDVHVYREDHEETFSSLDEAVSYYRSLYCATTPEKEAALLKYLGRKLDRSSEGLTLRGTSAFAILSWDVWLNRVPV